MKNKTSIALAVLTSLILVSPVLADTNQATTTSEPTGMHRGAMVKLNGQMPMKPGVAGIVASVNGNTITITSSKIGWMRGEKENQPSTTPATTPTQVTYTIDASKATVVKAGSASTVSAISVGDMIMVQGTVSGTNVVATNIRDGINKDNDKRPEATPVVQGNGQPIIAGTISAINGNSLTVTNKSNATYTVDASSAKIVSKNTLTTLSTVAVGDNVVVQGTINGSTVSAYSVMDQGPTPTATPSASGTPQTRGGFLGGIGQFFHHLFGF